MGSSRQYVARVGSMHVGKGKGYIHVLAGNVMASHNYARVLYQPFKVQWRQIVTFKVFSTIQVKPRST